MIDAFFSLARETAWLLRKLGRVMLVVIVALILVRAALPFVAKKYVNTTLDKIPGYRGELNDVDIHLWRGAYEIIGLNIVKSDGRVPVPFFSVKSADLSVQWRELFHGSVVGKITLDQPKLNFVENAEKEKSQTAMDESWQQRVQELFPLKINYLGIRDGAVHFRNFESDPPLDVSLEHLDVVVRNLSNARKGRSDRVASMEARGVLTQHGLFELKMKFDPFADQPTFKLAASVFKFSLPSVKDFTKHYGGVVIDKGDLNLYAECVAKEGRFEGYVKPFVENLHVENFGSHELTFGQKFKGLFAEVISKIFKNHEKKSVASKIEFEGRFEQPKVRTLAAVGFAFRHAFVQALAPKIENTLYQEQIVK